MRDIPEQFSQDDWLIHWHGWQQIVNQLVLVGVWSAHAMSHRSDEFWYCSTLGVCSHARGFDVLDLTRVKDWPLLTGLESEKERETVKLRALRRLQQRLSEVASMPPSPQQNDGNSAHLSDATS